MKLSIFSSPAHLPVVRAAVEKMCELMGLDGEAAGGVVLSVDEALANVIEHAYDGAVDQPIEIDLTPVGNAETRGLRICLADRGRQVEPSEIRPRNLNDVRPGGLGVHIMGQCMDRIEFEPREGGGTLLTMEKNIPPNDSRKKEAS